MMRVVFVECTDPVYLAAREGVRSSGDDLFTAAEVAEEMGVSCEEVRLRFWNDLKRHYPEPAKRHPGRP